MKYLLITIIFSLLPSLAVATDHTVTGYIAVMRSHTNYWNSDSWIQVEGVRDIDGCLQDNHGKGYFTYIVIPTEEKQLYSMLLAAFMSNKPIEVRFTTELTSGLCTIKYASLVQE